MGLLYENYTSPNELMNRMLKAKKFSQFVKHVVDRRNEEAEKESDNRLWLTYVLSGSGQSFGAWKNEMIHSPQPQPQAQAQQNKHRLSMTDSEIIATKNKARDILKGFKL